MRLLSMREAARAAGVGYWTLSRYISKGLVKPKRKSTQITGMNKAGTRKCGYGVTGYGFGEEQVAEIRAVYEQHKRAAGRQNARKRWYGLGRVSVRVNEEERG